MRIKASEKTWVWWWWWCVHMQVFQALDAALGQAAAVAAARQPLLTVALGLKRRLQSLGALDSVRNAGVVAAFSTGLVDTLPKQWSMGGELPL